MTSLSSCHLHQIIYPILELQIIAKIVRRTPVFFKITNLEDMFLSVFHNNFKPSFLDSNAILIFKFNPIALSML